MAPHEVPPSRSSLYPHIDLSNPSSSSSSPSTPNPNPNPNHDPNLSSPSSSSSLYPSVETSDLHNLLPPDYLNPNPNPRNVLPSPLEETIISIPGAIVHLIDPTHSIELAVGEFSVLRIRHGDNIIAVLARLSDEVQWPLMKDVAIVKLDDCHYFFSFPDLGFANGGEMLNYGLSFASKGQEGFLKELDRIFETYGNFSKSEKGFAGVMGEISPEDLESNEEKREMMARNCGAYWTTLAPNVEEYSDSLAKFIASGSGHLIKGILWCGDVAVDRLNWGHDILKERIEPGEKIEVDEDTLKRIQRVKRMTVMTKKVANGLLTGAVKVSGYFTSSFANSKMGKKFFSLIPGEVLLASLDGFNRICDAAEVAGKSVLSTTSSVTSELATHKYGEEAGKATHEGLSAAGHAIGTAWTVFKLRKALNPKSAMKPAVLAKSAAKAAADKYRSQKSFK